MSTDRYWRHFEIQHGKDFAMDLVGFEQHTLQIDLEPQEYLYENDGGLVAESERGLFFIESGVVVRIEEKMPSLTPASENRTRHECHHDAWVQQSTRPSCTLLTGIAKRNGRV